LGPGDTRNPSDFAALGGLLEIVAAAVTSGHVAQDRNGAVLRRNGLDGPWRIVDPESLRGLLARYFERVQTIVERHGGTVEKFIGNAVMAVFGVPVAHKDDALRAVRAATEMRDALPGLGVRARIGVMTGQVVTGTEERLATGDAVNVAARLEQAADPDEVLIGEPTLALVSDAVDVQAVDPLELKGKADPVSAYRLVRVKPPAERQHWARFVRRERELALVRDALERAHDEQRCELVTMVGDAGVGKGGSPRMPWRRSKRRWSTGTASPTARESRTGPSSRW
jgi:class 3 adenylate cyclase